MKPVKRSLAELQALRCTPSPVIGKPTQNNSTTTTTVTHDGNVTVITTTPVMIMIVTITIYTEGT